MNNIKQHPKLLHYYHLWAGLTGSDLEEQKRLNPEFAEWLDLQKRGHKK
jgi:hypothetical protein